MSSAPPYLDLSHKHQLNISNTETIVSALTLTPLLNKTSLWELCAVCCVLCLVAQLCLTLCDLMDCSLPGSSVLGISQARILEWVAIAFSRGSSQLRNQTQVSCTVGGFFII